MHIRYIRMGYLRTISCVDMIYTHTILENYPALHTMYTTYHIYIRTQYLRTIPCDISDIYTHYIPCTLHTIHIYALHNMYTTYHIYIRTQYMRTIPCDVSYMYAYYIPCTLHTIYYIYMYIYVYIYIHTRTRYLRTIACV